MRVVRIDDEVWKALQKRGQTFVDTPNNVLRRILGLNGGPRPRGRNFVGRIPRGEKTPEDDYFIPILDALAELGGRGRVAETLDLVGRKLRGRLKPADLQTVTTGQTRWRNTAQWARNTMANKMNPPLVDPRTPHGLWEMTQAGREYLARHQNDHPR